MSTVIKHPAIRYHGGKFRLASWIISHFPDHRCYVEPFGGAASVLLKKKQSEAEVYNDLDGDVVNLFRVLRDPVSSQALIDACALTPYSRVEFRCAYEPTDDPIEKARRLIVRATMGFGSAGATKGCGSLAYWWRIEMLSNACVIMILPPPCTLSIHPMFTIHESAYLKITPTDSR
ncbi:DNA adenine methylase [Citrobacter werkmanii]|uniref:DNA adenine methylase n=1 Tax=Citrobacter werkmanii TaxID=67827 RepID=A0A9N8GVC5_9ENTR|nr:DNA adenine methylase [Citrobacter werkmanii]CAB5546166.1 DNA adenine methylase [Citrobacter werkmanii]CAB5548637.1 DNA adenine methylase [Citrobacter werkmanii]CAB5568579.1 DNA adenine methylase [Citrobacter werkmanii]CAB5575369.1 DNA adenine methylase [Citrobacter werkmanii]